MLSKQYRSSLASQSEESEEHKAPYVLIHRRPPVQYKAVEAMGRKLLSLDQILLSNPIIFVGHQSGCGSQDDGVMFGRITYLPCRSRHVVTAMPIPKTNGVKDLAQSDYPIDRDCMIDWPCLLQEANLAGAKAKQV